MGAVNILKPKLEAGRIEGQPWTRLDAAKFLGLSVMTLRRAEIAGTLSVVRCGRRVLIPDLEVRRLAREGCRTI